MTYCNECGKQTPIGSTGKPKKYCSAECDAAWRRRKWTGNKMRKGIKPVNSFHKGHTPWNKDLKGIHLSPSSEFKPGPRPDKRDPIGTVRHRTTCKDGTRAWIKVADPNVWRLRAVVVWELANGPLPKGMIVHHKDRNKLNDALENLEALTKAQHLAEHRHEYDKSKISESLKKAWKIRRGEGNV